MSSQSTYYTAMFLYEKNIFIRNVIRLYSFLLKDISNIFLYTGRAWSVALSFQRLNSIWIIKISVSLKSRKVELMRFARFVISSLTLFQQNMLRKRQDITTYIFFFVVRGGKKEKKDSRLLLALNILSGARDTQHTQRRLRKTAK